MRVHPSPDGQWRRLVTIFSASLLFLFLFTTTALAQTTHRKLDGFCELGNRSVAVIGATSTTKVQQSFPSCTVTVFIAGTATPASICSDNLGPTCTPKANPFVSDANGYWAFFAASAQYDVTFTGGTSPNIFPSPFTRASLMVPSPFTGTTAVTGPGSSTDNAIVRWDGTTGLVIQNSTVLVGDTGNFTGVGTLNTHTIPAVAADTFLLQAAPQIIASKTFGAGNIIAIGPTMSLGSDGTGDIYYRNAGGILTRLGIGSSGQILSVSGGIPSWASGVSPPFIDTTAIVQGSADGTKQIRFEVDGLTSSTTRTITPPNADITIAATNFVNAWADGVKQTFNPDATNAGMNVGQHTTDPSSPTNGDCYYNSVANEFRCRINSTWVAISGGGGGGGGSPGGSNGNIQYRINASTFGGVLGSTVTSLGETSFNTPGRVTPTQAAFEVAGGGDSAMTADTENIFGRFTSTSRGFTQGAGSFTTQREWLFVAPTYTFTSADSINLAATLAISGAPAQGTNATITNRIAFWVQADTAQFGTGSTSAGAIKLMNSTNVNHLILSSGTTSSAYTLTFPDAPPAGDRCLRMTSGGVIQTTAADCGAGGGGTTINPSDNVIPYRQNSTTFQDSNWSVGTGLASTSTVAARSGGSPFYLRILTPADILMAADTLSVGIQFGGNTSAATVTRQFSQGAGAFNTQYEYAFIQPTYSFTSADSIVAAATVFINGGPVQGTNATIGQSYALWSSGDTRIDGKVLVNLAGAAPTGQLHVITGSASLVPAFIQGDAAQTAQLLLLRRGSTQTFAVNGRGHLDMDPVAFTSGTPDESIDLTSPAHTDLANSEAVEVALNFSATVNFTGGGGAIADQRVIRIFAPTYTADAAQTITTAALLSLDGPPVASTNITFTNPALSFHVRSGPIQLGVPSTATGSIRFAVSGDADVTTLQAGDTPASAVTYKWPADDPAATQVLTVTSFSGGVAVLEWAAGGGGSGCTPGGAQGDYQINNGAGGCAAGVITQGTNGRLIATPTVAASGVNPYLRVVTPADTAQTLDQEFPGIILGGNASGTTVTRQGADGTTVATQREVRVVHPTYAFAGATTITDAATFAITGPPLEGTNATITNNYALWVQSNGNDDDPVVRIDGGLGTGSTGAGVLINGNATSGGSGTDGRIRIGWFDSSGFFFPAMWAGTNAGSPTQSNFFFHYSQNSAEEAIFNGPGTSGTIAFRTNNGFATPAIQVKSSTDGQVIGMNIAPGSIAAQLHLVSGSASRVAEKIDSAANSTVDLVDWTLTADDTTTAAPVLGMFVNSNGTPGTNFGGQQYWALETTTTNGTFAASETVRWSTATHASRVSEYVLNLVDNATAADVFFVRGNGQIRYNGLKRQTANTAFTSNTTFADLTGLTFNVVTGRQYKIKFQIYVDYTSGTGGGAKLTLNGSATFSALIGGGHAIQTATLNDMVPSSGRRITALGSTIVLIGTTDGGSQATMIGEVTLVCNGSGTIAMQGAQQGSDPDTTTFLTNSTMEVWEISN